MKLIGISILAYAALVTQVTSAGALAVVGLQINLLLLAVVAAAITLEGSWALVAAAGIGLLADSLSRGPLGIDMLSMTLFALLLRTGSARRGSPSIVLRTALVLATACPTLLLSGCARSIALDRTLDVEHLTTALTTAVGSALVFCFATLTFRACTGMLSSFRPSHASRRPGRWTLLAD